VRATTLVALQPHHAHFYPPSRLCPSG
jgi:hypothetical protein